MSAENTDKPLYTQNHIMASQWAVMSLKRMYDEMDEVHKQMLLDRVSEWLSREKMLLNHNRNKQIKL